MLTVPEAARRVGRNPETVRRWIREGKLRSQRVGTQHIIDEEDLGELIGGEPEHLLPKGWETLPDGRPTPNVVKFLREDRAEH